MVGTFARATLLSHALSPDEALMSAKIALKTLKEAAEVTLTPKLPFSSLWSDMLHVLTRAYRLKDNSESAITVSRSVLAALPKDRRALQTLTEIALERGEFEMAKRYVARAPFTELPYVSHLFSEYP